MNKPHSSGIVRSTSRCGASSSWDQAQRKLVDPTCAEEARTATYMDSVLLVRPARASSVLHHGPVKRRYEFSIDRKCKLSEHYFFLSLSTNSLRSKIMWHEAFQPNLYASQWNPSTQSAGPKRTDVVLFTSSKRGCERANPDPHRAHRRWLHTQTG